MGRPSLQPRATNTRLISSMSPDATTSSALGSSEVPAFVSTGRVRPSITCCIVVATSPAIISSWL